MPRVGYAYRVSTALTDFERGAPFAGDYDATLAALRERLSRLQLSQIVHRKRLIILLEGWEGAGKRSVLKLLGGALDPCHVRIHSSSFDRHELDERHWLARYWSQLPAAGETSIFYLSWYAQLAEARASGAMDPREWARATDEINEFESQQHDHGTVLIKLFFHISAAVQAQRHAETRRDPWRRWLMNTDSAISPENRGLLQSALEDGFRATDTRWAPWRIIDANDARAGRIVALTALADAMEKAMPSAPPVEGDNVVSFRSKRQA